MTLEWLFSEDLRETDEVLDAPRMHRRTAKRETVEATRFEALADFLKALPAPGESFHIVSNGRFDFWNYIPHLIELLGGHVTEFYGSTWTMNRGCVTQMCELMDAGKIGQITILTGDYFKRRETAVYATLVTELDKRQQRYLAFKNHAKILLLTNGATWLTVEGSANFTANYRMEQAVLSNDRALYEFHKGWIEEMLRKRKRAGR